MRIPVSLIVLLFTFAEIAVFIAVGGQIGVLATLGLTLLASAAGVSILRRQSVATVMRVRAELAAGRTPAGPVVDGALIGAGALLLVVPGFITDLVGLTLLIPAARRGIRSRLSRRFRIWRTMPGGNAGPGVVELAPGEYASRSRPDTPWRSQPVGHRRPEQD